VEFAQNLLSTRRGTFIVGGIAAALAAIVLLVYLSRYRDSINAANQQATVLVARQLIQQGSPGEIVASTHQFQVAQLTEKELKTGALTDPSALRGMVAAHDIFPGQQLTTADFVPTAVNSIQTKLTGDDRAVSVPVDAAHGLIGQISEGDHVDVYVGLNVQSPRGTIPVLRQLLSDVLVLRAPGTGATGSGNIVLRAPGPGAAALAFGADNGKLWVVLRPASGAQPIRPGIMTAQRLLLGVAPVK
jgi:Flp pilus assembly protein CpaB